MAFIKNKEDFKCENCGFLVAGDGYTNHCRECLWSKHVDIDPGDRLETCCGLMKPIGSDKRGGEEVLIHECIKCGKVRRNRLSKGDNYDKVIALAAR